MRDRVRVAVGLVPRGAFEHRCFVSAADWIRNVAGADFETEVVERSKERPVVADFWAAWCAPCRTLEPILEALVEEHRGAFLLARVDADEAPELAQGLGIRSVPTVLGFRGGQLVAEFVGAQPEAQVRAFLERVLPSAAERLTAAGEAALASGDLDAAGTRFREALEQDPRQPKALLGLARIHADRAEAIEALEILDRVPPGTPAAEEAARLAAGLRARAGESLDAEALRTRVASHPADLRARLDLGRALAARSRFDEALEALIEVVRRDHHFADEAARTAMLDIFEILGAEHPLTERYRRELAAELFR